MLPRRRGHQVAITAFLEISLRSSVAAPAQARDELTAWLEQEPHEPAFVDAARLLVSELVTNCLRHATIAPNDALRLTASLHAGSLRLELHDNGTDGAVERRPPQTRDHVGGFGLDLVALLSSDWGVQRDEHGTTVWLELPDGAGPTG